MARRADAVERAFSAAGWRGRAARATGLIGPWALYAIVLNVPWPDRPLTHSYTSSAVVAVLASPLLWICYGRSGWLGSIASLSLTLGLFAFPLLALWNHLAIHYNAIGGLLPFSDASGYYFDASRLLDGHPLGWSARRPLFVGLLATLLGLTGRNLQVALSLLVALNAIACFFLVREVRIAHGRTAAVAAFLVLFFFYRVEGGAGTTLTENLGFALGMVGFAVLWQGIRERRAVVFCVALALITVGLLARAGAFFVLPALVLAGAWVFGDGRRAILRFAAGAVLAIAAAAALNVVLGRTLADPLSSQTAFSNFSHSLYGLVVGGKGWAQVMADYPDAKEGAEMYGLAWQAFRDNPTGLVTGSLNMWREYLPFSRYHAFAFVRDPLFGRVIQSACYALCLLGLGRCIRRWREGHYLVIAAGVAGHLASVPFVPPIDAGLRVYAVTIPLLALLVGIGSAEAVGVGVKLARRSRFSVHCPRYTAPRFLRMPWSGASVVFGLVLVTSATVAPIIIYFSSRAPEVAEVLCPAGQSPIYVRFTRGSFLNVVVPASHNQRITVPEIRARDLRFTAGAVELRNDLDRFVVAPTSITNTYDLKTGRIIWLVSPTHLIAERSGVVWVCGNDSSDPQSRAYGVFFADSGGAHTQ